MKKEININNKKIILECNALTLVLFKNEFKKDFLASLMQLSHLEALTSLKNDNSENIDSTILLEYFYIFAKTAERGIKPYYEFLAETENILTDEKVLNTVLELIQGNLPTGKK